MAPQAGDERRAGQGNGQCHGLESRPASASWHQDRSPTSDTHADVDFLSAAWGGIEPELRRVLRALLQPADVDDVVQEVFIRLAARAERRPLVPDAVGDLARLAAWRLGLNTVRDAAFRAQPRAELPEAMTPNDLEEQAVWHMDLDRVLQAIEGLSDPDRQAIRRALSPQRGRTKREQDRLSLRLFRARTRLRARVTGVLGGLPAWRWRPWHGQLVEVAGSATASVVLAALVAAFVGGSAEHPTGDSTPVAVHAVDVQSIAAVSPVPETAPPVETPAPRPNAAPAPAETEPELSSPAPSPEHTRVAVPGAGGGEGASVGTADNGGQEELACIGGGGLSEDLCVPDPLD